MQLKDISFDQPERNILFDEVLLLLAEQGKGGEVLRFWESSQTFVVLGKIGNPQEDIYLENVLADKIPVLKRSSGGGTVLQGHGCLNYSLILSKEAHPQIHDLRKSYQYILTKVIGALASCGYECVFKPISDIARKIDEKKNSGNAQKRGRRFILHHGTILYDFDLTLMERYLRIPKDMPEYRRARKHTDFLTNFSLPIEKLKEVLSEVFFAQKISQLLSDEESRCLDQLLLTQHIRTDLLKNLQENSKKI